MAKVGIVTDSTADLRPEVVKELGIVVVPLSIRLGTETLVEGPGLRSVGFHRRLASDDLTATAVAPRPGQFAHVYGRLAKETSGVVSVHLSSRLNGTVQAAREGRLAFLGRCQVSVIDSQAISRALGILVTEAAKAAADGASAPDIERLLRGMIPRIYLAFYLQNPDDLRRKGLSWRPPHSTYDPSERPILTMEEGQITRVHRMRGRGTALERLFEFVAEFRVLKKLAILHSGLVPQVEELRARLAELLPGEVMEEHIYGPALGTYIGPAALGVVAFEG